MWSQQELADLLGTTQNTVSRWELGITNPSPYFTKKLCEIFGRPPQDLGFLDDTKSAKAEDLLPRLETSTLGERHSRSND